MRMLRLALILLTIASLPGSGLAATGHVRSCPERGAAQSAPVAWPDAGTAMHAMDMADMAGMDVHAAELQASSPAHDCCAGNGHPQQPARGKSGACSACLAGHGCQGMQGAQPPGVPVLMVLPLHPSVVEESSPHASLCGPDGLLRPPKLS